MSKVMCKLSFFVMLTLGDYMILYYQNGTLYVNFLTLANETTYAYNKQRIFRIVEEYGIANVVINLPQTSNKNLVKTLKKEYYENCHGHLIIKDN